MRGKQSKKIRQVQRQVSVHTLGVGPVFLKLTTTLVLILIANSLFAQYPGSSRGSQGNNFGGNRSGARGSTGASFDKDPTRDTLSKDVFIYYADNAEKKEQFQDSSMINFHIYDPVRQAEYEHVHLGNLGSAHRQIVYQPRFHKGFDAGFHNYDLYKTKPEDIPYYNLEKVYSDIYFSQANQERTSFNANVGKPIGQRANMGIYYKNIRNLGQYTNQDARANAFSATLNYQSKNQKYRSFFSVTTNTIQQKENGGGDLDNPDFAKRVVRSGQIVSTIPAGRPVNTETGESRYFERDINYTQFYILQKTPKIKTPEPTKEDSLRALVTAVKDTIPDSLKIQLEEISEPIKEDSLQALESVAKDTIRDSLKVQPTENPERPTKEAEKNPTGRNKGRPGGPKNNQGPRQGPPPPPQAVIPQLPTTGRKLTLKHNLSIRKNTYKYSDVDTTAYLSDFIKDERGVRSFIQTNQIENTFSIRTFKLAKENKGSVYGTNVAEKIDQKDLIEAGITHTFTDLSQEPFNSNINTVFLFGKMQFTPSERLKINTYAHFGILGNEEKIMNHTGDYYAKGDFFWDTKKLGKIDLSVMRQQYEPSLIQQRFLSTQMPIWENDFAKIKETSLSAKYAIPKLKIDLAANYHLIENFIYYDTLASPKQFGGDLNILQLVAKNQIDVWRFHLQNTVYLQTELEDKDIIRFPKIYGIHRLYLDLKLFKVMDGQLGGEVRWNTPYFADNFQPLTAQFFQQNEQEIGKRRGINEAGNEVERTIIYPTIDVFYNFRIQQFRFFLVAENLWHFYPNAELNYNTYSYPIPDFQMRFGFRWLFLD